MNKAVAIILMFYAVVTVISGCYIVAAIVDQPQTKIEYRKYDRRWQ